MQRYLVIQPLAEVLNSKGYEHAAALPVVFKDGGTRYDTDANEFLFERCLGYWPYTGEGQQPPVTSMSQRTYAHALADFLSYAATRNIEVVDADYVRHVYGRYQSEMLAGTWSSTGNPLSESTVNSRVDRACEYLAWLAYKGRRPEFLIPTRDVDFRLGSHKSTHSDVRLIKARIGRARHRRKDIRLPTDQELGTWLASVDRRHGPELVLAFELILQTAVRKAELVGWRIDTIPKNESDWVAANPMARPEDQSIIVSIRYGTKGRMYGKDAGDKIGPRRDILVPLVLARRIREYCDTARRRTLLKLAARFKGAELSRRMSDPHLFLDGRTGEPLNYDRVTNCWRNVAALPFKGWSPHGGRHWWACMKLWRGLKVREAEMKSRGESIEHGLIALGTDIIRLEITDQLGHVDAATTHRYIRWVALQLGTALPTNYAAYLEAEDANPSNAMAGEKLA
jgi:integrase